MNTNLKSVIRKILVKFPSFGHTLANIQIKENELIQTACTNGQALYYNPNFIDSLSESQKVFLLSHEICHVELEHMERGKDKNPRLWNIATDAVINAYLEHAGLEPIEGCVQMPDAYQMRAEDMYDTLLKEAEAAKEKQDQSNEETSSNEPEETAQKQQETMNAKEQEKLAKRIQELEEKYGKCHASHEDWKEAPHHQVPSSAKDEKAFFKENEAEKQKKLEDMRKQIIAESTQGVGQESFGQTFKVEMEEEKKKVVDWKKILKATLVGNQYDWRLSHRVRNGVVPYELKKVPHPVTEILLDTSGSISDVLLRNFLNECMGVLKTSRLKVGCFDTRFYGFHEIRSKRDIENLTFEGRGGTDFNAAVNAFSKSADNRIVFTDGCADTPEKTCRATWVIFDDGDNYSRGYAEELNPPGGKKIMIPYDAYWELSQAKQREDDEYDRDDDEYRSYEDYYGRECDDYDDYNDCDDRDE